MEIEKNNLENVAGGKVIESKDGKFFFVPDNIDGFDTREAAEKAEKEFKEKHQPHHHFCPGKPPKHCPPFGPKPDSPLPLPIDTKPSAHSPDTNTKPV